MNIPQITILVLLILLHCVVGLATDINVRCSQLLHGELPTVEIRYGGYVHSRVLDGGGRATFENLPGIKRNTELEIIFGGDKEFEGVINPGDISEIFFTINYDTDDVLCRIIQLDHKLNHSWLVKSASLRSILGASIFAIILFLVVYFYTSWSIKQIHVKLLLFFALFSIIALAQIKTDSISFVRAGIGFTSYLQFAQVLLIGLVKTTFMYIVLSSLAPGFFSGEKRLVYFIKTIAILILFSGILFLLYYSIIYAPKEMVGRPTMHLGYFLVGLLNFHLLLLTAGLVVYSFKHLLDKNRILHQLTIKNLEQLKHLRLQLQPHFFFNSLNNINGLALQEGSPRTSSSIMDLSNIMQYVVYDSQEQEVALRQEMNMVSNYIEMQKNSYEGDDIEIVYISQVENSRLKIEPLILFPLVENAFKHGISREHPSFVRIRIEEANGTLHYYGSNSIRKQKEKVENRSIGQNNLKKRLGMRYPGRHTLQATDDQDVYTVELTIKL